MRTGVGYISSFSGGFDEPVRLEVVIDASAGEAYGRLAHSGGIHETPHVSITASEIAGLTEVAITEDYRSGLYLGAEYDNITVVVPEPTSSLVFLIGAAGFVLLNRFRSA